MTPRDKRRNIVLPAGGSVLDEIWSGAGTAAAPVDKPLSADKVTAEADSSPTPSAQLSEASRTHVGQASHSSTTDVQRPADSRRTPGRAATGKGTTSTGNIRQTFFLSERVVDQLQAAADQMKSELRDVFPKHVILDALILAGLAQADAVRAQLLTQLFADLPQRPESNG